MAKKDAAQAIDEELPAEVEIEDEVISPDDDLLAFAGDADEAPDLYAFLTGAEDDDDDETIKPRKLILFRGNERPYAEAKAELDNLTFRHDRLKADLNGGPALADLTTEERAEFENTLAETAAELPALQERVATAKEKLFKTAIVIELVKPHAVAIEKAERRARRASPGRRNNEDAAIRFNSIAMVEILARAITKVSIAGKGDVPLSNRLAVARLLMGLLPTDQKLRLSNEVNDLVYADKFKDLSLLDPGFLAES